MRQFCYFSVVLIFFFGCSTSIQKQDLKYLNGYWEIAEVEFANGKTKEYDINTTIDFIELNGLSGFRKKMQPQLNGSYKTSDDAENFRIIEKEEVLILIYGEGTKEWEEEIITLDKNLFSVRNQDGKIYRYKRYEPLNLKL